MLAEYTVFIVCTRARTRAHARIHTHTYPHCHILNLKTMFNKFKSKIDIFYICHLPIKRFKLEMDSKMKTGKSSVI